MHLNHPHNAPPADTIDFSQFLAVDIRIGTILSAEAFPEARKRGVTLSGTFFSEFPYDYRISPKYCRALSHTKTGSQHDNQPAVYPSPERRRK